MIGETGRGVGVDSDSDSLGDSERDLASAVLGDLRVHEFVDERLRYDAYRLRDILHVVVESRHFGHEWFVSCTLSVCGYRLSNESGSEQFKS